MDPNTKISWSRISWYYHFHCVSEANAWASAHALSMVMWFNQQIVTDLCSLLYLIRWKMTFDGRWPLSQDGLYGWRPLMEGSFKMMVSVHLFSGRLHFWGCPNVWCRIHSWKMTSMEDDLWWKTTFDGRRPWMVHLTFVSVCRFMSYFVPWKLTELDGKKRDLALLYVSEWPRRCGLSKLMLTNTPAIHINSTTVWLLFIASCVSESSKYMYTVAHIVPYCPLLYLSKS